MSKDQTEPAIRRALSMWQPFASLLLSGIKRVDSRSRNTNFRGEFYIHASQAIPRIVYDDYYLPADKENDAFRKIVNTFLQIEPGAVLSLRDLRSSFIKGKIIGKATLVNSLPSWSLKERYDGEGRLADWDREFALGDHGSERWAWEVSDPEEMVPTPIKGRQMLFWPIPDHFIFLK